MEQDSDNCTQGCAARPLEASPAMPKFKPGDQVLTTAFMHPEGGLDTPAEVLFIEGPRVANVRLVTGQQVHRNFSEMGRVDTAPPLEDQVKALKVGDKVRVVFSFEQGRIYTVEGTVWKGPASDGLFVGESCLVDTFGRRTNRVDYVEVLETVKPAVVAFYTNQPADRQPLIRDVWTDDETHTDYDRAIFNGYVWIHCTERGRVVEIRPGQGRLVHPSELDGEEES